MDKKLASKLEMNLASLDCSSDCNYISKVPEYIREVNAQAYKPLAISIGPIHYGDSTLEAMQKLKWKYLKCFLENQGNVHHNNLEHFINVVRQREDKIREYYEDNVVSELGSDKFIQIILLDAIFIIYYCLECNGLITSCENLPQIPGNLQTLFTVVRRDLFLVENQIPFFILLDLYHTSFASTFQNNNCLFTNLVWKFMDISFFFSSIASQNSTNNNIIITNKDFNPRSLKHLVHLYWIYCLKDLNPRSPPDENTNTNNFTKIDCLTLKNLQARGVKIVASEKLQALQIEYNNKKKGVLKVPKIIIDDYTESWLRNILYFEQCHSSCDTYIADYLIFLDTLIDTQEDVQILVDNEILIDKGLGSNQAVAELINSLARNTGMVYKNYYYLGACRQLNAFAKQRWNSWNAILKSQYFNHPWAVISFIGAIILFILTITQTINSFSQ